MKKCTSHLCVYVHAVFWGFVLGFSAGRVSYAQSPADSLEIYDPFVRPSEIPRILDTYFSIQGAKESARLDALQSELEKEEKGNDRKKTAGLLFQIGDLYTRGDNSAAALVHYFKALRVAEEIQDTLLRGLLNIRIGRAYALTEILLRTQYTEKGCELLKDVQDKEIRAIVQYALCANESDPVKSDAHGREALRLQREVMKYKPNDTTALENLSKYLNAIGRWEEAIAAAERAGSSRLIVYYLNNYGYDNHLKGKYAEALALYTRAVRLCKAERLKGLLSNTYQNLGLLHNQMGDYKNAARYLELHMHVKESMYRENYVRQYAENIVRYETEAKEMANAHLKLEQERLHEGLRSARVLEAGLALLLLAVGTLLVMGFFGRRKLHRANLQLVEQKEEIDKRRQESETAHKELSASELKLNAAQRLAQVANWEWDPQSNTFSFSDHFPVLFDVSRSQLASNLTAAILNKVHPDDHDRVRTELLRADRMQGEQESRYRIIKQGETRWMRAMSQIIRDELGKVVKILGTVQDITAQHQQEEFNIKMAAEQSFTVQLMESQEEERKRIASEIHDGLGQEIVAMKSLAEIALLEKDTEASASKALQNIVNIVPGLLQSLRRIAYNLRPVHLERTGLTDTLVDLFRQVEKTSAIALSMQIQNIDHLLPVEKELHVFRIVQEATSNILKHSHAVCVAVEIHRQELGILIRLHDDGIGFDWETTRNSGRGFGLQSISNRVEVLGGMLAVFSAPGSGTTIIIQIPVSESGK